jgi:triacylglycerol lipase
VAEPQSVLGYGPSTLKNLRHNLRVRGLTVEAMSYPPVGTSVAQLADRLAAEVDKVLSRTGADKMHLVGHSLGGVLIAQAIADGRLDGRVDTVITLGSPFGGSPWADLLPVNEIVRALRHGSPVLRRLASTPLPDSVRWLSVTAALDIIVPGPAFSAIARSGGNHQVRWRRPSRDACEPASNRMHSCDVVRAWNDQSC